MDSDDDDKDTWIDYTKDVVPLDKADIEPSEHSEGQVAASTSKSKIMQKCVQERDRPRFFAKAHERDPVLDIYQLGGSTDHKLRRGKLPIEARIDLHGMTRDQAYTALENFVLGSQLQEKSCVLVITGKGKNSPDIQKDWWEESPKTLRACLPEWVTQEPLRSIVVKIYPAQPEHGDSGAFYLYLRRLK